MPTQASKIKLPKNQTGNKSMQTKQEWLQNRVTYIKGLKSPNNHQASLVLLAEKPNRNAHEEKSLTTLITAEKAAIRAAKARQEANNMIQANNRAAKEAERKARNHLLITQGALFGLAGLGHRSKDELLGALLALAAINNEEQWILWKKEGSALLAKKSREVSEVEKEVPK